MESRLHRVLAVEVDPRRPGQRVRGETVGEPVRRIPRGRTGAIAHPAERSRDAPGDGAGVARQGRHDGPGGEQLRRVVLVVADQVDDDGLACGDPRQRRQDPRRERVRVDRDGDGCRPVVGALGAELAQGLPLQKRELLPEAKQRLACLGRPHRFRAHDEDAPHALLESLDALADRTRGHVQAARRRVEGAVCDDGGQGLDELGRDHQSH